MSPRPFWVINGPVMSPRLTVPVLAAAAALTIGWARHVRPPAVPSGATSPTFSVPGGRLRIEVCADDIVRVAFAKDDAFFARPSLMAAPKRCTSPASKLTKTDKAATLATAKLRVTVDLTTGAVAFADASGRPIAAERAGGRSLTPATVMGESTHHVRQQWEPHEGERLYGLGQHQQGLVDIKGTDLELRQYNGEIVIPLLVSNRGYGILWDNTSLTRFGRTEPPAWEEIPGTATGAADWTRTFTATVAGDYQLRTYSAGDIQVDAGDRRIIEHWRQGWLPGEDVAKVPLRAGESVRAALPLEGGHRREDRALRRRAAGARPASRRRCGPRSATASTTGSSMGRRSTAWSPATARSPARRR